MFIVQLLSTWAVLPLDQCQVLVLFALDISVYQAPLTKIRDLRSTAFIILDMVQSTIIQLQLRFGCH